MPKGTPGFTLDKKYDKIGWMSSAAKECIFENSQCGPAPGLFERFFELCSAEISVWQADILLPGVSFKIADMAMNKV